MGPGLRRVRSTSARVQLAQILIPERERSNNESEFFAESCRDIVSVVVLALALCTPEGDWTFRDLLLALLYTENLKTLLSYRKTRDGTPFPSPERVWRSYFDPATTDDRTRGNIRTTLSARLGVFEPVAAAWASATEPPFSLTAWQEGNEIIVLGNDESARSAIDPINRALFQRAAELTLARPEGQESQTWFFLDEVREAGRLQTLNSLLLKGRSKGASVVLSFQDIDGLRDVYGTNLANEIVANCNNVALLRTSSASTAEWAAAMFGRFLATDTDRTSGTTGTDINSSSTKRFSERPALSSGDLLYLPLPSEGSDIIGFFRDARAKADEPKQYAVQSAGLSKGRIAGKGEGFRPVKTQSLFLKPWTSEDLERLGLRPPKTDSPRTGKKKIPRRPR